MAKKVRKPRSESPRTYAQLKDAPPPSPSAAKSGAPATGTETRTTSRGRAAQPAPAAKATAVDWQREYSYVFKDLRRTFILAAGLLILLIVLNFVLQVA